MKGPGLFSDIGKKARDVLTKGYTYDQKLTMWTPRNYGLRITSAAVMNGGVYSFDIGTQCTYNYKSTTVDVRVDTNSNITSTITMSEILPSTKAITTLKLPNYNSGKLEVQYFHDHASLVSVMGLKKSPVVDLSGAVGAHGVAFGAEAAFDTASGTFTKYSAGISLRKPDYVASVILADKGDTLRASYVYHLDEKQKTTLVAEVTRRFSTNDNTLTVGGSFAVAPQTTVKSRPNNSGMLAALLQHELIPRSVLTICSEIDTKALERAPK